MSDCCPENLSCITLHLQWRRGQFSALSLIVDIPISLIYDDENKFFKRRILNFVGAKRARVLVRMASLSVSTLFSFLLRALLPLISALPHRTCPPRPPSVGSPRLYPHLCSCLSFPVLLQPSSALASLPRGSALPCGCCLPLSLAVGRSETAQLCRAGDSSSGPSAPLFLGQRLGYHSHHAEESCGAPRKRAQRLLRRVLGEPGCPRGEVGWEWGAGCSPSSVSSSSAHRQLLPGLTLVVKKEGYLVNIAEDQCREGSLVGASDFSGGPGLSWRCRAKSGGGTTYPHIYPVGRSELQGEAVRPDPSASLKGLVRAP